MAAEVAIDAGNCVHVDQGGAVDLPERLRIDFLGECLQRPPDQPSASGVTTSVYL
jgi:hypothetical protein